MTIKKSIIFLLIILFISSIAEAATSRRMPKAAIFKTLKTSGGDYTTLSDWEAATDKNLTSLTTLSSQADAGQAVINLVDATPLDDNKGWEANDTITIAPGTGNEETHTVQSRSTNAITLTANLANTHASGVAVAAGMVLKCNAGAWNQTVTIAGATTNANFFRVIQPASGAGHSGIPKTDGSVVYFYHSGTSPNNLIWATENYFSLQDIVAKKTGSSASDLYTIQFEGTGQQIIGVITVDCANTSTGAMYDFHTRWVVTSVYIVNCLSVRGDNVAFFMGNATNTYIYNCSAINTGGIGFQRIDGTVNIKNCLSKTTGNGYTGTFTATTCGSSDATSPTVSLRNQTYTFVDAGADDFHFAAGSTGIDQGTDLSADANFAFDDDINDGAMGAAKAGQTRSGTWDLGFDEYIAPPGGARRVILVQ